MQISRDYSTSDINSVLREAIRAVASSISRFNYDSARQNIDHLGGLYSEVLRQGHLDTEGFPKEMIRPSQAPEIMENMLKSGGNRFAMMDKSYRKTKCGMETRIIARLRQTDIVASVVPDGSGADFVMAFAAFVRGKEARALDLIQNSTFDMIFSLDLKGVVRRMMSFTTGGMRYRREAFDAAAPRVTRLALRSVPDFIQSEGFVLDRIDARIGSALRRLLDTGLVEGAIEDIDLAENQLMRLRSPVIVALSA